MKIFKFAVSSIAVSAILFSASATNITISDNSTTQNPQYYWDPSWMAKTAEDNEVEPGCETGQNWDLEAFLVNGTTMTVVSGYNLQSGFDGTYAGDIFVDVGGNPGYDYVYDIDWASGNYNLYQIEGQGTVNKITMAPENVVNVKSNPLSYNPDPIGQNVLESGNVGYVSGIKSGSDLVAATGDAAAGALLGANNWGGGFNNNHNIASVDISQFSGLDATYHLTMSCGNDNLMGHTTSVPEPGSFSLILLGLASIAGAAFLRRKSK